MGCVLCCVLVRPFRVVSHLISPPGAIQRLPARRVVVSFPWWEERQINTLRRSQQHQTGYPIAIRKRCSNSLSTIAVAPHILCSPMR